MCIIQLRLNDNETYRKEVSLLVNKIAELRKQKGYTQQEFAKRLKISVDYLNRIERGRKDPSIKLAVRIAKNLDCTLNDLFF